MSPVKEELSQVRVVLHSLDRANDIVQHNQYVSVVLLYFLRGEQSQHLLVQVGYPAYKVGKEVLLPLLLHVTSLRHTA